MFLNSDLYDLNMARTAKSRRSSSYARDGSNVDFRRLLGETQDRFYDLFLNGTRPQLKRLSRIQTLPRVIDLAMKVAQGEIADVEKLRKTLDKENSLLARIAAEQ